MINSALPFLKSLFQVLHEKKIDLTGLEIDHLCYRTSSQKNYQLIKEKFSSLGQLLIESEVNGRDIATYKLHSPVEFDGFIIPLVEVPAPKKGKITEEGWEHIEIVTKESFDNLIRKYSHLNLETKALAKELNPELVIKFDNCAIKFHHQSLEEVIRIEKELLGL